MKMLKNIIFCFFVLISFPAILRSAPLTIELPDHLEPLSIYPTKWLVPYKRQIRSQLKLDSPYILQMLVLPSFSGEYAVRLHGKRREQKIEDMGNVFLTYSIAKTSIWDSMPENNGGKTQKNVVVNSITVDFPKPLAKSLVKIWTRMLQRTRDAENDYGACDGTTYEFSMLDMSGQTWSPQQQKSPLLFVELGEALIAYCKAAPADRLTAEETIEKKASQLTKYLNAHR
jgi:hypothetical protein